MVILVIALVIVAIGGPIAGYFYAVARHRSSGEQSEADLRQMEDEIRRLRGAGQLPLPSRQHSAPPAFPPLPPLPSGLPGLQQAESPPPSGNRFAYEPPLFGDEGPVSGQKPVLRESAESGADLIGSSPSPPVGAGVGPASPSPPGTAGGVVGSSPSAPVAAPRNDPTAAPRNDPATATPSEPTTLPPSDLTSVSPNEAPTAPLPAAVGSEPSGDGAAPPVSDTEPPAQTGFRPVSEMIDAADAEDLAWLGDLTAGRRIRLKRLGYDAPAKLANLRRSEIRRLARELDVSELDIRDRWVPAAAKLLKRQDRA
jgi:predicted flap endonuclease-1-like 5' DNA nuclease